MKYTCYSTLKAMKHIITLENKNMSKKVSGQIRCEDHSHENKAWANNKCECTNKMWGSQSLTNY